MPRWSLCSFVGCAALVLLMNTAYLAVAASPTVFYMTNVLLHVVGGGVLWVAAVACLRRQHPWPGRRPAQASVLALTAAVGFAAVLVWRGNLAEMRWALVAHAVAGAVAVAALLPLAWRLTAQATGGQRRFGWAYLSAAALLAVVSGAVWSGVGTRPVAGDRIVNPLAPPSSMDGEGGGPASPFFPSSAQTDVGGTIPADFFLDSELCGDCHKDVYEQWKGSVHHFASFNNQFYRKSIEYMQSVVGTRPSKWCAGCHDHAVFFNGRFDRPIAEQIDTPEAQAGLACTSCHAISKVEGSMGNGGFTIAYPPLHRLASSRQPLIRAMDRFLTYLDPEPHRRTFMKPFMRLDSSEYCAACHKVHLDVPVNRYRWIRGFNEYDNWQASAVSGQGARSFYYPEQASTCVDCHMPRVPSADPGRHADGMVHSHRFPGANTAVPFVNHDTAQLKVTTDFLTSGFVSVDIFAVSPVDDADGGLPMVRRTSPEPQAMSSLRGRRGGGADRAGGDPRSRPHGGAARSRRTRSRARVHGPPRRGGPHPEDRPLLPGRHRGCLRRLARSAGSRRRPGASSSGAARSTTRAAARSSPARTSIARTSSTARQSRSTSAMPGRRAACCTCA